MVAKAQDLKAEQIDKVLAIIESRLDKKTAEDAINFVRLFYERPTPEDLLEISPEHLYGSAVSLYKFAATRAPGKTKLRVFTPNLEEHGWKTTHSVVEIVNDDMPFLVDSVTAALNRRGLTVHQVIHPVVYVERDADGNCLRTYAGEPKGKQKSVRESIMHFEIDEQSDPKVLLEIEDSLRATLDDVRVSVADWKPILAHVDAISTNLKKTPPPLDKAEIDEALALLHWMSDNHFTFLGYREFEFAEDGKGRSDKWKLVEESGLGILRDPTRRIMTGGTEMSPEVKDFLRRRELIIVTKANVRSTVHRAVHLDYVGVKKFNEKGEVIGEHRFTGLFTSAAYNRIPRDIPYLRRKVSQTLEMAGFSKNSHDEKAFTHILESYPRDELFQISVEDLLENATKIMSLQERPRIGVLLRRDRFERFVSVIIYIPREKFNTDLRRKFGELLAEEHNGTLSSHYALVGDDVLARIHYIISLKSKRKPVVDEEDLERRLIEASRSWADDLIDSLLEKWGEEKGLHLRSRYGNAFPAGYKERFNADLALYDIEKIEAVFKTKELGLNLYRWVEDSENTVRFKVYSHEIPLTLSDCLPMLENMGLKVLSENPYLVTSEELKGKVWIHDFELIEPGGFALDLHDLKAKFEETFRRVWTGNMENDGFNRLVLRAGLDWANIVVLRAFAKYLRQAGITFSQTYMMNTLSGNPEISRRLIDLFYARCDPAQEDNRDANVVRIVEEIWQLLDEVSSLDEDRILRRFVNLIVNTLRTNVFQNCQDEQGKPYYSFKLDSQKLDELPLPRPAVEIFVYSPRVEGVHLRGGKVARGGLRWSDRREDYRTEVLGLMKAQMVKNTVIVPVGSKGGFYPKNLPTAGSREEILAEGINCYKIFISGLLDITDNYVGSEVVPPKNVVRHDGDDPYLVVAADKGTATFSDIANAVAISYGFWLGDAFASGGAAGYDHKKMGITARGAWESVKRHFREMGIDTQSQEFDVAGIGDMSGDVFGNGMLLSKKIRLVAAFDHRNIFIDPTPDAAKSHAERERIFALPRSSWEDYNPKLISAGGGIFDRKAKSISLSPEIKKLLDIKTDNVTPNELITTILKMKVDLLWFGGIGTYIKATHQSNGEVGDRANDAIRVNGKEVRAKVIGEGGNLGVTQLGRIEYALNGGRLNTDAIDNSAGVDCSDHEVNIKILLRAVLDDGEMTEKQRDRLLVDMTDAVADHVLIDNYLQSQALTMAERQSVDNFTDDVLFMRDLEKKNRLNRSVENLPDDDEITRRLATNIGLSRPEISVLLAYAKMTLYEDILETSLPDDPFYENWLAGYFPPQLREKYAAYVAGHRLRREIITTVIVNQLINRGGPTFVLQMQEELGCKAEDVARAFAIVCEVFDLEKLWAGIEALDNKVSTDIQGRMIDVTQKLARRVTLWCLRHLSRTGNIAAEVKGLATDMRKLEKGLEGLLSNDGKTRFVSHINQLVADGVPEPLARRVAALGPLRSSLDVIQAGKTSTQPITDVGEVYFAVGAELNLDWLRTAAETIEPDDNWDRLAITAIIDDLYGQQRAITTAVFTGSNGHKGRDAFDFWCKNNQMTIKRTSELIKELKSTGGLDISKLVFANQQFRSFIT
ncbi:NAD-glutamate dehydrogenase [Sneathiella litorea]|uniref:NAD-glutamate dehydrogenase n=1 Tax=Sneathiella litorea TaxID=2606216 RepID=A0A6L8W605_9PROT|nr:NAD-glutamate dehydrogenase [Sneathiella litorea]MZR29687.1 NAD-glutamate dehydrogenase [Sneathiella litorea]